jgi:hypothetical protein
MPIKSGINISDLVMSQHFLLSREARTLSLATVARMTEEQARDTFRKLRWTDKWRGAILPEVRLPEGDGACDAPGLEMRRLQASILCHVRDDLRGSQAPGSGLPSCNCNLRERRERSFRAATQPRSGLSVQDGFRARPQDARGHERRTK